MNVFADTRLECEIQDDVSVVAWGACVCNQDAKFRRACCGVFFSIGDDRNRSFILPGREQSNNRAERLAAIATMRVHAGNLEIQGLTDSECVVRLATGRLKRERQLNTEGNADFCGPDLYLS